MRTILVKIKNLFLNLFFPRFCLNCGKEGNYLCKDCRGTLEILESHQKIRTENLKDLYWALPYQNPLVKKIIQKFKHQPFIKELAKTLASLIIAHFQLIEKPLTDFSSFILIPLPLEKKRLKWRGFNQAEEIAKELSQFLKIPLLEDCLIKIKETSPQIEPSKKERKGNIKGAFLIKNKERIRGKKILLIDDVYTTGAPMEECARLLKEAGAKEIIGVVVARE